MLRYYVPPGSNASCVMGVVWGARGHIPRCYVHDIVYKIDVPGKLYPASFSSVRMVR